MHNDRVVLDETARSAEDDDTAVRRVRYHIIPDDAVGTTETDAVGPLLERVGTTRANIVILNDCARAGERSFCEVKARPRAGVIRVDVFNLEKQSP